MTRSHYEVLQVSPDASRAEIRTAYRAACLRTHPDKAKPEDKKKAEYEFRRVQQAYEVLSDDEKRNAYDYQRTNPAAERQQHPFFYDAFGASSSRGRRPDPFNHPFFNDDFFSRPFPFGRSSFPSFGWPFGGSRDPFEDMMSSHRRMADELSRMAAHLQSAAAAAPVPPPTSARPFPMPPQTQTQTQAQAQYNRAGDAFMSTSTSTNARQPSHRSNSAAMWSFMNTSNSQGGRWVSESHSESWINGQRHTTHKRRDPDGIEHVTHTYPDGTTRYLVNGVEQPRATSHPSQHPRAIDIIDADTDSVHPDRPSRDN